MTDEPLADEFIELEPDLPPGQEPEEGEPTSRRVKKQSALQQGTEIPSGWKPSVRQPVPVVRCNYTWREGHPRAGERCGRWSLRGTLKCFRHSGNGNLKNIEEYRKAIIDSARLELTENVPMALETLFDLAQNSGADNVRLKAVTEILDRTGIKTADQLEVSLEVSQTDPAAVLAERLGKLKDAADKIASARAESRVTQALALTPPEPQDGEDIVDAEVVDDTPSPEEG